ncbi:TIGR04438 family Trp-rich protein [uncultured Aquabacterium sp.]|uniref:TIGR04438 family Trp-rich protein n=1 Tax=uncultured Aquabacterium sp. TaxID=158753 RepID=UPI0025D410AC|nr:TIGR04438 family Trp-rich protein [uncultured Aquabacterium sp.]
MGFLLVGIAMLGLFLAGIGPWADWTWRSHWWALLAPFAAAAIGWWWSDTTGRTQRQAMEKVEARREARRRKSLDALGMQDPRKGR